VRDLWNGGVRIAGGTRIGSAAAAALRARAIFTTWYVVVLPGIFRLVLDNPSVPAAIIARLAIERLFGINSTFFNSATPAFASQR
jgi:hypothetical protein